MKKIYLYLVIVLIACSCSDELTNKKAEIIIKDCLVKELAFVTRKIMFGEGVSITNESLDKFKILETKGLLTVSNVKPASIKNNVTCNIELTDKGKEYATKTEKVKKSLLYSGNMYYAIMKLCQYELDKVNSVYEVPSMNAAEVEGTFKKVNETPFSILASDTTNVIAKKLEFKKLNEKGWVYCE